MVRRVEVIGFLLAVAGFVVTSCDISRMDLRLALAMEAEACPKPAGVGMVQSKAELTDTCVLFVVECDETLVPVDEIRWHAPEIRKQFLGHLYADGIEERTPLHEIAGCAKNCNLPLVWVYEWKTGDQVVIRIEPREIK